jgi:hypothetical protein
MMMLVVGAPVLIEARASRAFLEEAQHLAGEMARALAVMPATPGAPSVPGGGLDDAVARLRAALAPLLQALNPEQRVVAGEGEGNGNGNGNGEAR